MPQTLRCPNCQARLQMPSLTAEQPVQCPRCQLVFAPLHPQLVIRRAPPAIDDEPTPDAPAVPQPTAPIESNSNRLAIVMTAIMGLVYGGQVYFYFTPESALLAAGISFVMPFIAFFESDQRSDFAERIRSAAALENAARFPLHRYWWICFALATGLFGLSLLGLPGEFGRYLGNLLLWLARSAVFVEGLLLVLMIRSIMQQRQERLSHRRA